MAPDTWYFFGQFSDTVTSEFDVPRYVITVGWSLTIRSTSYQKISKNVGAVFEKIAKNLEKRPFSSLFGQYVRNEIENWKSGSVVRLLTSFSNSMQNFRKIHSANSSRPRVEFSAYAEND